MWNNEHLSSRWSEVIDRSYWTVRKIISCRTLLRSKVFDWVKKVQQSIPREPEECSSCSWALGLLLSVYYSPPLQGKWWELRWWELRWWELWWWELWWWELWWWELWWCGLVSITHIWTKIPQLTSAGQLSVISSNKPIHPYIWWKTIQSLCGVVFWG